MDTNVDPVLEADEQEVGTDGLTPEERKTYDEHVAAIRVQRDKTLAATVRLGNLLLELVEFRKQVPRHKRARTWALVCTEDLGIEEWRSYELMNIARVQSALESAGEEPLSRESHSIAVSKGQDRHDPEAIVETVRLGREIAAEEGKRLIAHHLDTARWRLSGEEGPPPSNSDGEPAGALQKAAPDPNQKAGTDWPWSEETWLAFRKVPRIDREGVREALFLASTYEAVTADTVEEAAALVAAERHEDGGSGRPAVVGAAEIIIENDRRRLLEGAPRQIIEDIDLVPEGDMEGGDAIVDRPPLLVVVPTGLCPDGLLDAYDHAREQAAHVKEVVVELSELEHYGGPVRDGVLDIEAVRQAARDAGLTKRFNKTGKLVGWAMHSTNGSTGCSHGCSREFCYASDLALKFYPQGFVPTIHPARLDAFENTSVPDGGEACPWAPQSGGASVFYGSMTDIMNRSFPDWWVSGRHRRDHQASGVAGVCSHEACQQARRLPLATERVRGRNRHALEGGPCRCEGAFPSPKWRVCVGFGRALPRRVRSHAAPRGRCHILRCGWPKPNSVVRRVPTTGGPRPVARRQGVGLRCPRLRQGQPRLPQPHPLSGVAGDPVV